MRPIALMWLAVLPATAMAEAPSEAFFKALSAHCGKTYEGKVVSTEAVDDSFRQKALVMQVKSCTKDEIRIPFAVGEDRSRTWVITRLGGDRLRLKHDHRHADGHEDELSQYGGDTITPGTVTEQTFPVDAFSIALFTRTGRSVSNTNVWTLALTDKVFAYQLSRQNRLFRVEFDVTQPKP